MENKFRIEPEKQNEARIKPKPASSSSSGSSMFSGFEKKLKLETYFEEGFPVQYLPKILFVMLLSILYIGNAHHADKTVREINRAQSEVEDLRADYTTLKADVMFASKQSEVARRVKEFGLKESIDPPFKIVVDDGEY
ncbi:MAG TPA: FtsL-like putative cell division protein [Cyclobacteriaceae bacterium]|nr:FtsL-like putative cell division protein [Cyclobacteriaceae bacterium]